MSMYIGEALVGEGNEIAHIDLIIGPRGSPAEHAFATTLTNQKEGVNGLLADLGLARCFGSITYSEKVGVEKPDRRIFLHATAELGVEPAAALHVGDGRLEDVEGAVAAGLKALHLTRNTGGGDLSDLADLPALVAAERAGRADRRWAAGVIDF